MKFDTLITRTLFTIKEWVSVWLFITIAAVGFFTVAVLMPFYAMHRMIEGYKDRGLFNNKGET
tara:strand:- start:1063 stop:1251 length:189 start_codon:yes stop_codon:yes gene_type:complete